MSKATDPKTPETAPAGLQFDRASAAKPKNPYQAHVDQECKHPATPRPDPTVPMHPYGLD